MIYANYDVDKNIQRFFYQDNDKKSIEILAIHNQEKSVKPIEGALSNDEKYEVTFKNCWLDWSIEFSKNTLTLKNNEGKPCFEFDETLDKPLITVHSKETFFKAPSYKTATNAGLLLYDKTNSFRSTVYGLTVFLDLIGSAYAELEDGKSTQTPVAPKSSDKPNIVMRGTNVVGDFIANAISLIEEGKPYTPLPKQQGRE